MTNWRCGLTREQIREAEMNRGAERIVQEILAEKFDPNYEPPKPTHYVSREGKEYNRRLREQNKERFK